MRAAALGIAALATALGGCSALLPPAGGPYGSGSYAPLRAHIVPQMMSSSPQVGFFLSRPAHVAMFRIAPGQGTTMIFPSPGYGPGSSRVYSGWHSTLPQRHWNPSTSFSTGPRSGPVFYFLIASEEPLMTADLGAYGHRLNSMLGVGFASHSAYGTMERLASLVVPDLASESWTTDFFVEWPELDTRPRQGYVLVQCNGLQVYAPPHLAREVFEQMCRRGQQEPTPVVPVQPGDSTGIVEPIRRPPVDVSDRIASTQLSDPERMRGMVEALERSRAREAIGRRGFDGRGDDMEIDRRRGIDDRLGGSRDVAPERRPARDLGADAVRGEGGGSSAPSAPPARERPEQRDRFEGRTGTGQGASPAAGNAGASPSTGGTERRDPAPPRDSGGGRPSGGGSGSVDPV
jgi:hypothetical protein